MKNRMLLVSLSIVVLLLFIGWWLRDDPKGNPLVCEQVSPGVKHAKECTAKELTRVRAAYRWSVENSPQLAPSVMAGIASFIEDTGRRKNSTFYQRLSRGDVDGACEQMMAYVNRRGEFDPDRAKRRENERALCLSKG